MEEASDGIVVSSRDARKMKSLNPESGTKSLQVGANDGFMSTVLRVEAQSFLATVPRS